LCAWEQGHRDGKPCPVPQMVSVCVRLAIRNPSVRRELGLTLEEMK